MYRALAVLCSCIGRKGMFFHACMHACRYPSGSIYAMDLSLYRSEQQLVKWSPVDQHIAKICIYIIIKTNLNRREFVPGSLFAEADHFLQPKVIRPDQLLQLKVIGPDQFLPGSIFA